MVRPSKISLRELYAMCRGKLWQLWDAFRGQVAVKDTNDPSTQAVFERLWRDPAGGLDALQLTMHDPLQNHLLLQSLSQAILSIFLAALSELDQKEREHGPMNGGDERNAPETDREPAERERLATWCCLALFYAFNTQAIRFAAEDDAEPPDAHHCPLAVTEAQLSLLLDALTSSASYSLGLHLLTTLHEHQRAFAIYERPPLSDVTDDTANLSPSFSASSSYAGSPSHAASSETSIMIEQKTAQTQEAMRAVSDVNGLIDAHCRKISQLAEDDLLQAVEESEKQYGRSRNPLPPSASSRGRQVLPRLTAQLRRKLGNFSP
jgi:hypothetical protein